jgi:hypothetical protein
MSSLDATLRRELRVAFSRRAQLVWFRIVKWTCILVGVALFYDQRWFWWTLAGLAAVGTLVHFIYRWKTAAWTRARDGWKDLESGRD